MQFITHVSALALHPLCDVWIYLFSSNKRSCRHDACTLYCFQPANAFKSRDVPFPKTTTQKDEFVKWPLEKVEVADWAKPRIFTEPNIKFATDTLYKVCMTSPTLSTRSV